MARHHGGGTAWVVARADAAGAADAPEAALQEAT